MLWLKACPRCRGDLSLEMNEFEEGELSCLQCGYRKYRAALRSPESAEPAGQQAVPLAA